jgi:hypothetical protein
MEDRLLPYQPTAPFAGDAGWKSIELIVTKPADPALIIAASA